MMHRIKEASVYINLSLSLCMSLFFLTEFVLFLCVVPVSAIADTPVQIASQIEQLCNHTFQAQLQKAHFSETPDFISIRIYKDDAELEIWAGNNDAEPMKLLAVYPICAMGFNPGTKLKEGDERTPEGSFKLDFYNHSKQWFMHINLTPSHIDDPGNVKNDPSFFLCTDYPTNFDKKLSASIGIKNPGSAICLHGNCVSVGCASMESHNFIEIYYWLTKHDLEKYGPPRAHFLPFRYYESCGTNLRCSTANNISIKSAALLAAEDSPELSRLGKDKILTLWYHIRNREMQFLQNPTPLNAELEMSMDILSEPNESE